MFLGVYGWRVNIFGLDDGQATHTVYPKKYAHGFCFAVLSCGYTLTDFPISIRLTSLALWQSNDCSSASKATLMNMDKYFMWIHYERLHNHNKAKHNKTVCILLGIYCICGIRGRVTFPRRECVNYFCVWGPLCSSFFFLIFARMYILMPKFPSPITRVDNNIALTGLLT